MQEGQLANALAFRAEKDRFGTANAIAPEDLVNAPALLRSVQEVYLRDFDDMNVKYGRQLLEITRRYVEALSALSTQYLAKDDAEAAEAARSERERILDLPVVRNAGDVVRQVGVRQAERTRERKRVEEVEAQKPATPEATLYKNGAEPSAKLRRYNQFYSGPLSRSAMSPVSVDAQLYTHDVVATPNAWFVPPASEVFVPRISLGMLQHEPVRDLVLAIDYVVRKKDEKQDRRIEKTEVVKLPELKRGDAIVVDAVGLQLSGQGYRVMGENGMPRWVEALELDGLIVSIYDAAGKMLYQRCTKPSLSKFATEQPPLK